MCVGSGVGVERQEEATENLGPAAMTRRWWCRWRPGLDLGVIFLISFLFMHLFVAVLGLRCAQVCGERRLFFIAVCGVLVAVAWASVVVARRLKSCRSQALKHRLIDVAHFHSFLTIVSSP